MAKSNADILNDSFVPSDPVVDPNQQLLDSAFTPLSGQKIDRTALAEKTDVVFDRATAAELDSLRIMNDLMTADVNVADPVDITFPSPLDSKPIGFGEAIKQARGLEILPFVGSMYKVDRIGKTLMAAERLKANPSPPVRNPVFDAEPGDPGDFRFIDRQLDYMLDRALVEKWVEELDERQRRGISVPGRIGEGVTQLPGFVIEFMLTGPTFRAMSKGGQEAAERILLRAGIKKGGKLAARGVGALVGTAGRTGAMATRVTENTLLRLIPDVQLTDKGKVMIQESKETPFGAFIKGFGDVYIENLSEISGGAVPALFRKVPFLGKFTKAMKAEWLLDNPGGDFLGTMLKKGGFNGFVGEMGEERLGDVLRAATGLQDFGGDDFLANIQNAAIPNLDTLLTEAGVIAPLAAVGVAGKLLGSEAPAKPAAKKAAPAAPAGAEGKKGVKLFHGTSVANLEKITAEGFKLNRGDASISLSKDKSVSKFHAKRSGKGKPGEVVSVSLSKDAKIFTTKDVPAKLREGFVSSVKLDTIARQQGFDGIDFAQLEEDGIAKALLGKEGEVRIFNPDILSIAQPAAPAGAEGKKGVDATRISPIQRAQSDTPAQVAEEMQRISQLSESEQKAVQEQAVKDVKSRISKKPIRRTPGQFARDILLKTDKAFRDEFTVLRKAVKTAGIEDLKPADDPVQLAVAFTQKSSAKTRGFVIDGTTNLSGNRTGKSLKEAVAPVVKRMDDFTAYLVAARDMNLSEKETGINPVAARLTFDALDNPEFAAAARDVTAWNHAGVDLLVESGAITGESGKKIKDANPIYVPFFREFAPGEQVQPPSRGKGAARAGDPIKRLKGSQRKIVDPFTSMIQQMDRIITTSQRATVSRAMANLVERSPEGMSEFMSTTKAPVRPISLTPKEIRSTLEDIGVDFEGVEDVDMETMFNIFRPTGQENPLKGLFKLRVDGKDKWFKIEKELADVLMGMDQYRLPWYLDIMFGKPTRAVKLGATGLNPAFGLLRNPMRDIGTFTVTSEFAKGGPFSAIGGVGKDVVTKFSGVAENFGFEGLPKFREVELFSALGGEMSGFVGRDRRGVKHLQHEMMASNGVRYTIQTFRHPVDLTRRLIGITEGGVRVGEFGPALKQGEKLYGKGSLSASVFALNAAQDVTVNFTRHGIIGKQLNEIIPFFNVAVQAPDKIVRSFRDRPFKSTASAVATMTVPAIGLWWLNKDKPWYRNMTSYEKANYLHFENPDDPNMIMRLPVPYELGHIFQALPVAILDQKYQENPSEVEEILGEALKQANPLDYPAAIGPIVDILRNEDFAGRPIVPRGRQDKLPEDQFGPHTDEIFKVIAKEFNAHAPESVQLSPANMEHMINSYSGGVYNRVSRMIDTGDMEKVSADIPVIGTLFVRDPFAPRRQIEDFYRKRNKLNQQFASKKLTVGDVVERIKMNTIAPVLNVQFDRLQGTETVEERKLIWKNIETLIAFDFSEE